MAQPIKVEGYHNYRGELHVGISFSGGIHDKILTRTEAMLLRDALNLAIETPNRVDDEPVVDTERSACPLHRDPSYCGTCNYCEQSEEH